MYKPDDKDIDRLSRDAAEHYHAPGKPAWDALQQMLDKELPQEKDKKRRGFFFFWLLLGLLVGGSSIWYSIQNNKNNQSTSLTEKTNSAQKLFAPQHPAGSKNSPENNTTAPLGTVHVTKDAAAPISGTNQNDLIKGKGPVAGIKTVPATQQVYGGKLSGSNDQLLADVSGAKHTGSPETNNHPLAPLTNLHVINTGKSIKNSTGTKNAEAIITGNNKKKNVGRKGATTGLENGAISESASETGSATYRSEKNKYTTRKGQGKDVSVAFQRPGTAADGNTTPVADDSAADKPRAASTAKTSEQPVIATVPDTASVSIAPGATQATDQAVVRKDSAVTAKAKPEKSHSKVEKSVLLGLIAGIDESTVRFRYASPAGYNFGITAGYQFSKHWSVYTGFVYTKKAYKLNGVDYHPPASYWTTWVDLQTVDGYCRMWELPVTARYTFNPGAKTAFFANAGLSSYFMKQQVYNYTYKTSSGMMNTGWSDDKNLNHIFSILNLSAGFQKQIGKHMNWQIEPYTKIPLGGVGFGNIKLSSFGINLSVQYRHPIKR